ncbi:macrophage mannose receptor 1-like isoform X2 [Neocloeon triangulifer]|uniref:macrophage mannose receptor 1-like isoform X2 n=1 Tax=Neocloeon triangulifer TaxID=2078957 RepID=UPI00286ED642|nr:macrophage mannose receptor 1-like isoform X2 [Neocloeon triangulifer]
MPPHQAQRQIMLQLIQLVQQPRLLAGCQLLPRRHLRHLVITLSWGKARVECQKKGMDLANLETVEENVCVKHLISTNKKTSTIYLMALNKMGQLNYTQWLSGQALTYNDWKAGEPAAFATEDCAVIWEDKWADAPCVDLHNYICETPQPFDMCSNEKPFFISTNKLSFDDARAECLKTKMDLVSLETPDQNICLQRQLASLGMDKDTVHIGLTMEGMKNYTAWVNAKPLTYTDWSPGNPAQFGTEKCAGSYLYHWLDIPCTGAYNYACEDTVILDPCFNMTTTHFLSNDTQTWANARLECKKKGMELTSMETPQENICVKSILKAAGITAADRVWHSLNMFGQPDFNTWGNGEALTYNDWSPGNPLQKPWESCGAFEYGKWGDVPCTWTLRYVCESSQIDPCDPDQFVAFPTEMPFEAAVLECKKNGMTLSVPETRQENICIQRLLDEKGLSGKYVWNGLNKRGASNYTKWYNDAPLTYLDWNVGEPAQFPNEQCGLHLLSHWYDLPCEWNAAYVCEKTVINDPCKGLPSKYNVSSDTQTWGGARAACKKLGGDLVSIDSEKENNCVQDKIDLAGKTASIVFHGLNKIGRKNYTSLYSGASPAFTDWKAGEPAQFTTEHCGATQNKDWLDTACSGANAYVCEFPAPLDTCAKYKFFVSTDQKPYKEAMLECLKRNMTIVDLETVEENACFGQFLAEKGLDTTPVTIGLDKIMTKNHSFWSNNKTLTYTDWDVNDPESFASEHCVVAEKNHWKDAPCTSSYLYGCESNDFKHPCDGFGNYNISTTSKSWILAMDECKKLGGGLTSMETPEENICVRYIIYLAGKKDDRMWHSLNKMGSTFFTHWGNGELLTYHDFGPSYNPVAWTTEHCGAFESGMWGDFPCTSELPFVCEFNPAPKELCVDGQFELNIESVSYDDAKIKCKSKGMLLATAETVFENFCVQREILRKGQSAAWVYTALNKRGELNYTKWDSGALLTYNAWPPGEPSAFATQDCLLNIDGHWYDIGCTHATYYVCEKGVIEDFCKGLPSTFTISTDTQTWGGARTECKKKSMDLASIKTAKDHACIKDKIAMAGKSGSLVFHSLNKIGQKNYTQWLDGTALSFSAWKSGEPAQFAEENCVAYSNGEWIDTPCMGSNTYICESPAAKDICSKYKFFVSTESKSFDDARFECFKKNMNLPNLETPEENMCLGQYLAGQGLGATQAWIGLQKRRVANYSKWLNGADLMYTDWDGKNPEAFASEDCVVFHTQHWHDAPCGGGYLYACEGHDPFKHPCDGQSNYSVSTDPKTWSQARDECKKSSGDLVSMETPEENVCVRYVIYLAGKKDALMWHSLNKIGEIYYTRWANGELLTYSDFPVSFNLKAWSGEHCAGFENGIWGDIPCDLSIPYVCEFNPSPKEICTPGQFVISADSQTYDNAKLQCKANGMEIASAETPERNFCIQRLILAAGLHGTYMFSGLTKIGETNYTKWANGAPLTYLDWPPGEPAQFPSEECMIFWLNHWYDWACWGSTRYVCEKNNTGL